MRAIATVLLTALVAAACQESSATSLLGPPSGDIIIASDLPLTDLSNDTLAAEQAIRLAIMDHPIVGGRFKLAYWSLDDAVAGKYSVETGVQNVEWMIDVPVVLGMVGPFPSDVAAGEIPVANAADLVMVSPSNTRRCLTQLGPTCPFKADTFHPSGRINYFRIAPPDPLQGLAMARYAATHLGITRAGVINEDGAGGNSTIDRFTKELRRLGGDVLVREDVDPKTLSFKDFIASAQKVGVQAIFAMGNDGDICVARAQMPDGMLLLGTDEFANDSTCLTKAANPAAGIVATYADVDIRGSNDQAAIAAVRAFKTAYPRTSIVDYTFAAYDCARLLIAALEQAVHDAGGKIPNRPQVLAAVARIHYIGVTGTYAFDANGDATSPLMEIYDVENGVWVNKGKVDATASPN